MEKIAKLGENIVVRRSPASTRRVGKEAKGGAKASPFSIFRFLRREREGIGMRFKRVLLKLSGEVLSGSNGFGFDFDAVRRIGEEIVEVAQSGIQIAMVVGGGNMLRGRELEKLGVERAQGGLYGHAGNGDERPLPAGLCWRNSAFPHRVQTAIRNAPDGRTYISAVALRDLEKGRIVIFAAGTGPLLFFNDTAAALRAAEMEADCLLNATKVDGIIMLTPKKHPDAGFCTG